MIHFIVVERKGKYILDSISTNYVDLYRKFPKETIYKSETPLTSIYINKKQLIK
jgi:hypothetical protein